MCQESNENATRALQPGSFMASLGMKCQAGNCIYNTTAPQPPPPPIPHEHHNLWVRWTRSEAQMVHFIVSENRSHFHAIWDLCVAFVSHMPDVSHLMYVIPVLSRIHASIQLFGVFRLLRRRPWACRPSIDENTCWVFCRLSCSRC